MMGITLDKLVSQGVSVPDASVNFHIPSTLIRGPSDTGKSYIRDCLWYLLGGDKIPKEIPQSDGYDSLFLQFHDEQGNPYTIRRSLFGGGVELYGAAIEDCADENALSEDAATLLVRLAGAECRYLLRSKTKRGTVTGGDLRHWSLISQPAMISEEVTAGVPNSRTQRKASFALFLTGKDDSSIVLDPSKDEKIKIKALLESIDSSVERILPEIPKGYSKDDLEQALAKVNNELDLLTHEQDLYGRTLQEIRASFEEKIDELKKIKLEMDQSMLMVSRLTLLDSKYTNDLDRLKAMSDSILLFSSLDNQQCVICGTRVDDQENSSLVKEDAINEYLSGLIAESENINKLRAGLLSSLDTEKRNFNNLEEQSKAAEYEIKSLEVREEKAVLSAKKSLNASPKDLAEKRSEYLDDIRIFTELERLQAEREHLDKLLPKGQSKPIKRHGGLDSERVASITLDILKKWGFKEIKSVHLEMDDCDIKIDGRSRLSYGAGKRGIFLSAMIIALMEYALSEKKPHLGLVVLDSPIKSYSDPQNKTDITVAPSVIRDSFYKWLANRSELGQVIVLENEPILKETADLLKLTEFTGSKESGRFGFYPG